MKHIPLIVLAVFSFISAGYAKDYRVDSKVVFTPSVYNDVGEKTVEVENEFTVHFDKAYNPVFEMGEPLHLGFYEGQNSDVCAIYPKHNISFANAIAEADIVQNNMRVSRPITLNCVATGYTVEVRISQKIIDTQYAYYFGFNFYKNGNPLGSSNSETILVHAQ